MTSLTLLLPALTSVDQFAVASGEDFRIAACELVQGRDVADRTVKANVVVVDDVIAHDPASVVQRQRESTRMQSPLRVLCQRSIVPCQSGYSFLSFWRATAIVKVQWIFASASLRLASHAAISRRSTLPSSIRRFKHWRFMMPISISAMFSQLACFGV